MNIFGMEMYKIKKLEITQHHFTTKSFFHQFPLLYFRSCWRI